MSLFNNYLFVGGITLSVLSILMFAGLTVLFSYCNPNAEFVTQFCTDKSGSWFPLLGLPFGLIMVGYPFMRRHRTALTV